MNKHTTIFLTESDAKAIRQVIAMFDEICRARNDSGCAFISRADLRVLRDLAMGDNKLTINLNGANFFNDLRGWDNVSFEKEAE